MTIPVRVLIVEDDPVDLEATRDMLAVSRRVPYEIHTTERLRTAVEMIRSQRFDVLLLDLNLPESSGIETVDAIRSANDQVPIIVLTGVCDEKIAFQSLDHGTQDYLIKKTTTGEMLVSAIRYAIQRQQLLQVITTANELLEKKNQRLSDLYDTAHRFVDNVSHEFRTPLTVIKEYASIMRDGLLGQVNGEQTRFLDIVGDRADDLNTMVDDMLDISKLEAGLLNMWRRKCKVSTIVEELRPAFERKAAIKGVRLEVDIDETLPEVFCDDEKVGRVIINLSINAIKFSSPNGLIRIWAKEDSASPGLVIGVTDQGLGIREEDLEKLFERFRQLHPDVRECCKGFGLGLNIAKELVDLNFGEMRVDSKVGEGSTFSFTLPSAEPVDVIRRYLKRVEHLRDGSSHVTILSVQIDAASDSSTAGDVDAFLQSLLQRNDLLFRVDQHRWLLAVAVCELELDKFFARATKEREATNRNRLRGPLPDIDMHTDGTWYVVNQFDEIFEFVSNSLSKKEVAHV